MLSAIYGTKVGMTRVFDGEGRAVPVTVLKIDDNFIFQVKTVETDGYDSIQIGFGEQKPQRVSRPLSTHLSKAKQGTPKYLREIRLNKTNCQNSVKADVSQFKVGDSIKMDGIFEAGSLVDVVGISIGKGFAGVMKRHGMKGAQTITRGAHEYKRHGGSIGNRKFPGRVFKNKRMGGHMGVDRVMQIGLKVVAVRAEDKALLVQGSIPGPKNGVVYVRKSRKS